MARNRFETVQDARRARALADSTEALAALYVERLERRRAAFLQARPDIGELMRDGRPVFYTYAAGFYAEGLEPWSLPTPRKLARH